VWLPSTKIKLKSGRINIKAQSRYIQALLRLAINLGERYIFLGPPGDDAITIDEASNMTTPFSVTGLHSIAFMALVSAAQQLKYVDEGDVYDRLQQGSELYVKPLRTHVSDVCFFQLSLTCLCYSYFIGLSEAWAYSWDYSIQNLFSSSIHHQAQQR
jgi:hypothetical protein